MIDKITLKNLFRGVDPDKMNAYEKVLTFYRLIIELERTKEPDIKDFFDYPLQYNESENRFKVDIEDNSAFYKEYLDNLNAKITKFPLDLYVGLQFKINGEPCRLVSAIIDYNDFKIEPKYNVKLSFFEVNLYAAAELELLPERVEAINEALHEAANLEVFLEKLKTEIANDVMLDDKIYLALSSKSIALSQIWSELNNLKLWEGLSDNKPSLLKSFMLNESVDNQVDNVDTDSLIQITRLDDSQKEAVALALNSRLSVITGAPGTGKTQVIENILANALIRGKKVLVASKNNKAVDNVKDRFEEIEGTGFFLRFGSRENMQTKTLPAINASIKEIENLQDNTSEYENYKSELDKTVTKVKQAKKSLALIPQLQSKLENLTNEKNDTFNNLQSLKVEYRNCIDSIESDYKEKTNSIETEHKKKIDGIESIYKNSLAGTETIHQKNVKNTETKYRKYLSLDKLPVDELDKYLTGLKSIEYQFEKKFNGFWAFWHKRFSIRKSAVVLLKEVNTFPLIIREFAKTEPNFLLEINDFKNHKDLFEQIYGWKNIINNILAYKTDCQNELKAYDTMKKNVVGKYNIDKSSANAKYNKRKADAKSDYDKKKQAADTKYTEAIEIAESNYMKLQKEVDSCRSELQKYENNKPTYIKQIEDGQKWIEDNSVRILHTYIHHIKIQNSVVAIHDYKNYLPPNQIPWKDAEYFHFKNSARSFTDLFKICSVTSLSIKNAFPLMQELFDMVIIDEASQCDIASALPLLLRTKQLVVIGDPMQLKHITAIKSEDEQIIRDNLNLTNSQYLKYGDISLYDYCNALISKASKGCRKSYMLKYHYRCHNDIIGFSNDLFYGGTLKNPLIVKTDLSKLKGGNPKGIVLVDVKGTQKGANVNVNEEEVKKSIELAVTNAQTFHDVTIGIITPFRHQAERINYLIPDGYRDRIEANTVHKFQGDEKDIIIYSLVVTDNSPSGKIYWIDQVVPNLVNVAVTRAKSRLYVVGNLDYIRRNSTGKLPLGYLVQCGERQKK